MPKLWSLRYRLMGMTFLLIMLTVICLISLANQQMEQLFQAYLELQPAPLLPMGKHEQMFLHSVHQSLLWVGLLFAGIGLGASYLLARKITVPLQRLSAAAEAIRQGRQPSAVPLVNCDEIGQLTQTFNQMAEQLARTEQMRREFLANTAHELRTPLAVLQGNLENMLEGVIQPDMERIFFLQEEVMRLTRLVGELRELSLAEAGQLVLHREALDINALLQRVIGMLQPLFDEKGLQVHCDLAALPSVQADRDRMQQVFYNVLTNAQRYAPAGGNIQVHSWSAGTSLFLSVADDGEGIPAADLPHVFDYFYRADKSRSRESGGSGIGLSLARRFVESHGGHIWAANTATGGAEITMELPCKTTEQ